MRCDFCDTDHAAYDEMTAAEIAQAAAAYPARHLVLTGGEPTLQADSDLLRAIKAHGFYVQIETNGTDPCRRRWTGSHARPKVKVLGISTAWTS